MEKKQYSITFASNELMEAVQVFNDKSKSPPICSDFGSDKVSRRKLLKLHSPNIVTESDEIRT